jgi:osmotically-inducible protein OsmY
MKTDTQLQQDVIEELHWDPSLNAAQVVVAVQDGIVHLSGNVDSYAEKWGIERAVQRIAGVHSLAIEIDVELPGASQRYDSDILRSAEYVLKWSTYLAQNDVNVMVENGWVTLFGEVDWEYQRRAVEQGVRYLIGVKGVSDFIAVRPRLAVNSVKTEIEAALRRRAKSDEAQISVEVNGNGVTLSGIVHSWHERALATHSAWSTPGVRTVTDHMTVAA